MSNERSGQIKRFFSNPVVGFIGSIASVIGLGLAVYFYIEARETRELHCLVNAARAVVVHAGQSSRISITLDGAPVKRDVSAAQVAFWNEGRAAIKPDNILRSLVVKTSPSAPIIEATIRKRSREVVKIDLDRSRLGLGELTVRWNILEFHDGGVLQLVYLGDVTTPISAQATIEGQGELAERETENGHRMSLALLIFDVGLLFLIMAAILFDKGPLKNNFRLGIAAIVASGVAVMAQLIAALPAHGPPFGF